jgi:hypothetical protein
VLATFCTKLEQHASIRGGCDEHAVEALGLTATGIPQGRPARGTCG